MSVQNRQPDHPTVITRFLKYVALTTETHEGSPCCLWKGGRSRGGDRWSEKGWYGTFNPGGIVVGGVRAHVYIAWLFRMIPQSLPMRVPLGMNLDHRCQRSLCVNPRHLELVAASENQLRRLNLSTRQRMEEPGWQKLGFRSESEFEKFVFRGVELLSPIPYSLPSGGVEWLTS